MNALFVIVIAASTGVPQQDALGDWQLWYAVSSGWGGSPGIYIDSTGRNVAYGDRSSRDRFMDLQRGAPTTFCDSMPLTEYQIRKFAFRISSIPPDVLEEGALFIKGTCADEPNDSIELRLNGRKYYFGYSQIESCRRGKRVPDWLTSLANALRARYHDIKECGTTSSDATSRP